MNKEYTQPIDSELLLRLVREENWQEAFDVLAQPLHQWLYEQGDFEALASRSPVEQLILSFDYVQSQVGQGGFIQLIQNGYVSLLVIVIENLQTLKMAPEMAAVLDKVLQVFVLNKDILTRETSVEEFGRLYSEFKEFEILEKEFDQYIDPTQQTIVGYVTT